MSLDARLLGFRSRRDERPQSLAAALIEAGRSSDALEVIHLGLLDDENNLDLRLLEGRAFYARGDLSEAQRSLLRAARLDPRHKEPYRWLAQVLIERGDPVRAVQVLERALTIDAHDTALKQALSRAQRLVQLNAARPARTPDGSSPKPENSGATPTSPALQPPGPQPGLLSAPQRAVLARLEVALNADGIIAPDLERTLTHEERSLDFAVAEASVFLERAQRPRGAMPPSRYEHIRVWAASCLSAVAERLVDTNPALASSFAFNALDVIPQYARAVLILKAAREILARRPSAARPREDDAESAAPSLLCLRDRSAKDVDVANLALECPMCHTGYVIDRSAVGTSGVSVKCLACAHVFTVPNPAPAERDRLSTAAGLFGAEFEVVARLLRQVHQRDGVFDFNEHLIARKTAADALVDIAHKCTRVGAAADALACIEAALDVCPQHVGSLEALERFAPAPGRRSLLRVRRDKLLGTSIDNRYWIERRIGKGASGNVYAAVHRDLGRRLAIKVFRSQLADDDAGHERFEREGRLLADLQHPHLVRVHDLGKFEDDTPYSVMDLVEGRDLKCVLTQEGPLAWTRVARILAKVCDGVVVMHERGILHRDIKPENVMVSGRDAGEEPTLIDLGTAKVQEETTAYTQTGLVIGTPQYLAPEQIKGRVVPQSDIYAIGAVAFTLCAGRPPFETTNAQALLWMHTNAQAPSLAEEVPGVPEAFAKLIERCLEKSPADRPQTAAAVRDELHAQLRSAPAARPRR